MISSKQLKMATRKLSNAIGLHLIKSRNSRWQYELYNIAERPIAPCFVNLGAGTFYHPFWHNVDMPNTFYKHQQDKIHLSHDFSSLDKFPFETESVEIFYTSHVIEHLTDEAVVNMFKEAYRSLSKGGIIRITCPDMQLQYEAYSGNDPHFWTNLSPWGRHNHELAHRFVENFASCLCNKERFPNIFLSKEEIDICLKSMPMNEFFDSIISKIPARMNSDYPEGHINWFTMEKLIYLLRSAGFNSIFRSGYLQSRKASMREPRLFDGTCPELSLYIEAIK